MRRPLISVATCATALLSLAMAAPAAQAVDGQQKPGHDTFAVIGDVPYGAAQVAKFPGWIDQINADPDVSLAFHVGDIKNGSTRS